MRIRDFQPGRDLEFLERCVLELQEIERGCDPRLPPGPEMVARYIASQLQRCEAWNGTILVAEVEDRPVAVLSLFLEVPETEPDEPSGSYALISDLLVLPEVRAHGIGRALLAEAEARARAAGAPVLRLEVMAENREARRFYLRHGWHERLVQLEAQLRPNEAG